MDLLRGPSPCTSVTSNRGDSVRSPFWVEFGVRGMGVIPAGSPARAVRAPPHPDRHPRCRATTTAAIPFSDTHRHFGRARRAPCSTCRRAAIPCACCLPTTPTGLASSSAPRSASRSPASARRTRPQLDATNLEASCTRWYGDYASTPRDPLREVYVRTCAPRKAWPALSPTASAWWAWAWRQRARGQGHRPLPPPGAARQCHGAVGRAGRWPHRDRAGPPAGDYELQPSLLDGKGARRCWRARRCG